MRTALILITAAVIAAPVRADHIAAGSPGLHIGDVGGFSITAHDHSWQNLEPADLSPFDWQWNFHPPGNWIITPEGTIDLIVDDPISFGINDLTSADIGRTWTITETNASDFGLDWQSLANWIGSTEIASSRTHIVESVDTPLGSFDSEGFGHWSLGMILQDITITLDTFHFQPSGIFGSPGTHFNMHVVAHGVITIPEPSTVMLAVIALSMVCLHHHTPNFLQRLS
jgi:hypothetical protein